MSKNVFLRILIILLALPVLSQAQSVSSTAAARIAAKYIDRVQAVVPTRSSAVSGQSYYIFNDGDGAGFVIVAGDNRMNEVVGYSKNGCINTADMPPALQSYLSDYDGYVRSLGKSKVCYELPAVQQEVKPLLKTKWNQYAPFNNAAPQINGKRPPIGCVATAIAQVMNYHQWPERGRGELTHTPSYQEDGKMYGPQHVDFTSSAYQWNWMTRDCTEPAAAEAVAKLMYDVSVAVRMDYKPSGSGARMENAVDALNQYFDYKADLVQRDYMSSSAFMEVLRNELRQGFPVVFSGKPEYSGMGHAWVCDGFDGHGLFSMNWGWGGASDGYYDLSYLYPNQRGAGGSGLGGYVRFQEIIRIHPNKPGMQALDQLREGIDFRYDGFMSPDREETTRSEGLELKLENLGNFSSHQEIRSKVGVGVFSRLDDGQAIEVVDFGDKYEKIGLQFEGCYYEVKEKITFTNLHDGTYYLYPVGMTLGKETEWHKTSRPCFLRIVISGEHVKVVERTDKPNLQVVSMPEGPSEVLSGRTAEYTVRFANASTLKLKGNLKIVLRGKNKEYTYQPVNSTFLFMDNTEETRNINVSFADDMETGEYEMRFLFGYSEGAPEGNEHDLVQLEKPLRVKVWNTSESAYLSCMGIYVIDGNVSIPGEIINVDDYPGMQVFVKAINMGKKDFKGELRYQLEDVDSRERIELERYPYAVSQIWNPSAPLPLMTMSDKVGKMADGHKYRILAEVYSEGMVEKEYEWVHNQLLTHRGHAAPGIETGIGSSAALGGYAAVYQREHHQLSIETDKPLTALAVYTADGSLVLLRQNLSAGHHDVALSHLRNGVYIVVSWYGGERRVLRIVR